MQREKHPEAFIRTIFNVRLRSNWSVASDQKFIRVLSESSSVHILKTEITGYTIDETEERSCVSILTRGALYRVSTPSNADLPLLLHDLYENFYYREQPRKQGVDALLDELE